MIFEEEILEDKLVDVEEEMNIDWTESEKEEDYMSQGPGVAKDSIIVKQVVSLEKMVEPAFTRGPGLQVKKRRSEKVSSRERRLSLL